MEIILGLRGISVEETDIIGNDNCLVAFSTKGFIEDSILSLYP